MWLTVYCNFKKCYDQKARSDSSIYSRLLFYDIYVANSSWKQRNDFNAHSTIKILLKLFLVILYFYGEIQCQAMRTFIRIMFGYSKEISFARRYDEPLFIYSKFVGMTTYRNISLWCIFGESVQTYCL